MLRVPLESGQITISRAGRSTVFPANFQLLIASNPCPCGNFGSETKLCLCSARSIELYWKKFSAPLLDRIDLRVNIQNENNTDGKNKTTLELREEIARAVLTQRKRQGKKNAALTPGEIAEICKLSEETRSVLDDEVRHWNYSPRSISSCLKTARTIADMSGSAEIQIAHIKEALDFRRPLNDFFAG